MFDVRLRLYTDPETRGRILPALTIDYTPALNTSSTLRFTMSEAQAGKIGPRPIVAVETRNNAGVWAEARGGRMLALEDQGDDVDQAGIVRYSGTNLPAWLLSKNQLAWSSSAKDGERTWTNRSPGFTLNTFLVEAQARGWAPYLTWGFTASVDSAGVAWPSDTLLTVSHPLLIKAGAVLEAQASGGLCDWWTQGNTLHMGLAGSGVDRTTGPGAVALGYLGEQRRGRSSFNNVFTHLTVVPEKSRSWVYLTNTGADDALGRLEESLSLDGVESSTVATKLAQPSLQAGRSSEREYTVTYSPEVGSPAPFADYNIGDLLKVKTRDGWQNLRLVELTVSRNADGERTITAAFEHRFRTLTSRLAGRVGSSSVARIVGGASNRPIPSAPPLANPEPKAPGGFGPTTNAGGYDPETGEPITNVVLGWDAVAQAIDDSSIDVELYELWLGTSGGTRQRLTGTTDTTATLVLAPDLEVQAEVRARSVSGLWGPFSTIATFTTARASTPLAAPTAPVLYSSPGAVLVEWDGLLASGAPPAQFRYVVAEYADAVDGTYTPAGAPFAEQGTTITGMLAGDTVWVRLIAVDSNGLRSTPSTPASIMVTPEPAVPAGFAVDSNTAGFDSRGLPIATVVLDWDAVSLAVNGAAITVGLYELWLGADPAEPTVVTVTAETAATLTLPVDGDFTARLRAQSTSGLWSAFTTDLTFSTTADSTPLDEPTQPNLETRLGAVRVDWDGLLVTGAPPAQFRRVYAAIAGAVDGTYVPAGASFVTGGVVLAGLAVGSTVWVRLYAVDSQGNTSAGSEPASIVVAGVSFGEIADDVVGEAQIGAAAIVARHLRAGSIEADALAVGSVTANAVQAGAIETYHVSATFGAELNLESNEAVNIIVGQVAAVQSQTDALGGAVDELATYYTFGPSGAMITSPGSEYALSLAADGIAISESGVEVSRWSAGQLQVASFVGDEVVLGNHKIERYTTGTVVRAL